MAEMTIDGRLRQSPSRFEVLDPATGEVVDSAPECTREQLEEAMQAAQRAFRTDWRSDLELRRGVMYDCGRALEAAAEEIGPIATREQGMPVRNAIDIVRRTGRTFRRYADLDTPLVVVQSDDDALVELTRQPIGVIAAIKPWNVPISMAVNAIAPAFRAGCTVVLKPSPFTPLATLALGAVLREVAPAGTLNIVSGGNDLGQWMVEHPIPRGISFTGSIATGKKVNQAAATDLKRVLLELGGNDPAIVLDDVDPADVADQLFWRAFRNAGQICMAIKRVFVPEPMYDEVVRALADKARAVRVGNGLDADTQMGPINNEPQLRRVAGLVERAIADGATVAAGGAPLPGPGYFYQPTVLSAVAEGSAVVDEEQFGPVLPVLSYRTLDEAIGRVNAGNYGLGASVWSADAVRAAAVAERIEAGTVWVNTHGVISPHQPFAGLKWSGLGAENGLYSVEAYTAPHVVYRPRNNPAALARETLV